jgi:hypothetical protein
MSNLSMTRNLHEAGKKRLIHVRAATEARPIISMTAATCSVGETVITGPK